MDPRRTRARELVASALTHVETQPARPSCNVVSGPLCACREALRGYLDALGANAPPPLRDRAQGIGRLILDSSPADPPLGNAILQAGRALRSC